MTVFRVEFSIEDYIIQDWINEKGIVDEDFEDYARDFIDEYFMTTPDDVQIL